MKTTTLSIRNKDKSIEFAYPPVGPTTYFEAKRSIESMGLKTPSFSEIVSLIYTSYIRQRGNRDEDVFTSIVELLKGTDDVRCSCTTGWYSTFIPSDFISFTGTLDVEGEGTYIQDFPEIRDDKVFMKKSDLIKKLELNDPSVRFVPYDGYDNRSLGDKKTNNLLKGLAGEEGAEKLAYIASSIGKMKISEFCFGGYSKSFSGLTSISYYTSRFKGVLYVHVGETRTSCGYGFGITEMGGTSG